MPMGVGYAVVYYGAATELFLKLRSSVVQAFSRAITDTEDDGPF